MKTLVVTAALLVAPALALADGHASFHLSFPAPPTLAAIQPGVQVVVDHDEEVFYSGRRYWVQRDGAWYSAGHHTSAFSYAPPHRVPAALVNLEHGRYRHYRPAGHDGGDGAGAGHGRGGHGHSH